MRLLDVYVHLVEEILTELILMDYSQGDFRHFAILDELLGCLIPVINPLLNEQMVS